MSESDVGWATNLWVSTTDVNGVVGWPQANSRPTPCHTHQVIGEIWVAFAQQWVRWICHVQCSIMFNQPKQVAAKTAQTNRACHSRLSHATCGFMVNVFAFCFTYPNAVALKIMKMNMKHFGLPGKLIFQDLPGPAFSLNERLFRSLKPFYITPFDSYLGVTSVFSCTSQPDLLFHLLNEVLHPRIQVLDARCKHSVHNGSCQLNDPTPVVCLLHHVGKHESPQF